jgi:GNAT superfamily N-acetyltransferase
MTTRPLDMVLVRETVIDDWQALRDIRLEALRDAPYAFGSSYEREAAFVEPDWLRRIARGGNFLAFIPEVSAPEVSASEPAGLIGGYPETADIVELVSMYVRPKARGRGVGEALVAAVFGWAEARDAKTVHLWVTESNDPARALYERCGFSLTGERQPLPSDPSLGEIAMARPL